MINYEGSKKLNSIWGNNFLDNSTKTFAFKLHNNQLGTNSRVSHFVRGHDRNCTFCTLNNIGDENAETISHLFFDCQYTERLLENFYSEVFGIRYRMVTRSEFFVGFNLTNKAECFILDIVNLLVKKFIWDCKLRFQTPSTERLTIFIKSECARMKSTGSVFRTKLNRSPLLSAYLDF